MPTIDIDLATALKKFDEPDASPRLYRIGIIANANSLLTTRIMYRFDTVVYAACANLY